MDADSRMDEIPTIWLRDAYRKLPTDRLVTAVADLTIARQRALRNRHAGDVTDCTVRLNVIRAELARRDRGGADGR